jgi:NADPH:quinone reductase-like Zn-dependent oxidoreductase
MKAIVIQEFGGPDSLVIKEIPAPEPRAGDVVIKVKAFGVNHAEMHMRRGEWAESMPVSGIECVGTVASCPGGEFEEGAAVATLMGGLGRTINGSYAEYTRAPASNVVALGPTASDLRWEQLAAIPESYATAWTCLFRNLEVTAGQRLLIRGGTSAFGQAAVNLAVQAGVRVVATTRNKDRIPHLKSLGVEGVEIEGPNLSERVLKDGQGKYDAILELVGNSTLLDSLKMVRRGGRLCLAGFLGGLAPIADFNPLLQMASGVHFSFFGSFVFGTPEFPLSDVPLRDIVKMVADKKFKAEPSRVFRFEEIQEAHRVMEANEAKGKMVVVVG